VDKLSTCAKILQCLVNNTIIAGNAEPAELVRKIYSNLSDEEYGKKEYRNFLCSDIAAAYIKLVSPIVPVHPVYIYSRNFLDNEKLLDFNNQYGSEILNGNTDKMKLLCDGIAVEKDINPKRRSMHTIVNILIGEKFYITDTACGFIYPVSMVDLLRGCDIFSRMSFLDQHLFLGNSIHRKHDHYLYLTPVFWKNVYYVTSTDKGLL